MAADQRLICASTDLTDGGPGVRFEIVRSGFRDPAFVIRHEGRAFAFLNRCGHVPVELDWRPGEFFDDSRVYLICATHGALYAPDSGRCLGGRCSGKGLQPLPIEERDGRIFLLEGS